MEKLCLEYNDYESANTAQNLIQEWAEENVDGYNAEKWGEPFAYEGKFYNFIDERLQNYAGIEQAFNKEFNIVKEL